MFNGIYGYDVFSKKYWWYIECDGETVHKGEKGITHSALKKIIASHPYVTFRNVTSYTI